MPQPLPALGLVLASFIVAVGTGWAFQRGGRDFWVFHEAWRLAFVGKGSLIYRESPDRFLYAPGFAWLFAPVGALSRSLALALWCFAKAAVIGLFIGGWGKFFGRTLTTLGLGAWAVVLMAKPVLIDFQYGQINTFIFGACAWALMSHFDTTRVSPWRQALPWFVLGVAAVVKLYAAPLLLVPFFVTRGLSSQKLKSERLGLSAGVLTVLLLPVLGLGWDAAWDLHLQWRDSIIARGLPLESHNQSFSAFLHHYFSGDPTPVLAAGGLGLLLGLPLLSHVWVGGLSVAWTIATLVALVIWIATGSKRAPLPWAAVAIGLLIVPSHLVWKPYFVMSIPAAFLLLREVCLRPTRWNIALTMIIFVSVNLTGFDFTGHAWGARFEAASLLLWAHLACLHYIARRLS